MEDAEEEGGGATISAGKFSSPDRTAGGDRWKFLIMEEAKDRSQGGRREEQEKGEVEQIDDGQTRVVSSSFLG